LGWAKHPNPADALNCAADFAHRHNEENKLSKICDCSALLGG